MVIRQPGLLRAEEERDSLHGERVCDLWCCFAQADDGLNEFAATDRRGSGDKRAICDRIGKPIKPPCIGQDLGGSDCRFASIGRGSSAALHPRSFKRRSVIIHDSQIAEPKVLHSPCRGANVRWIACSDENDCKPGTEGD